MLPPTARVRSRSDFRAAVTQGRRARSASLIGYLRLGAPAPEAAAGAASRSPRVGFVVSRKVGSAVVRNRVRRRLRHVARALVSRLPDDAVLVVRVLPAAAGRRSADLAGELDQLLARVTA